MAKTLRYRPDRIGFPAQVYPRGPQWQSNIGVNPFLPAIWSQMITGGPAEQKAKWYERRLGYSQTRTPITSNWMPGLGGLVPYAPGAAPAGGSSSMDDFGDLGQFPDVNKILRMVDTLDEKGRKLETALTIILVLSGIAAGTGLINLLRR